MLKDHGLFEGTIRGDTLLPACALLDAACGSCVGGGGALIPSSQVRQYPREMAGLVDPVAATGVVLATTAPELRR